jgi:hypothetical protein
MEKENMVQTGDYSIIFKFLNEARQKDDFRLVKETMEQSSDISDEIEKLRDIVTDYEEYSFSVLTTV